MKKTNLLAVLTLAATPAFLHAQTNFSDIVGYSKVTIAGGGTTSAPKYTMIAVNLANPTQYTGTMASNFAGSFTAGAFNAGTFAKFYLEIVSTGARADIVSNTASNISLSSADATTFGPLLGAGQQVRIRKHRTLADVFGGASGTATDTTVPLLKGSAASSADNVLLMVDGAYKTFYYSSNITRQGWRDGNNAVSTEFPISPSDGLFIARKATASVDINIAGEVKSSTTLLPITGGKNSLVQLPAPVEGVTLTSLFGGDGSITGGASLKLARGTAATSADNVLVWDGSAFKTYYYSSNATRLGWRDGNNNSAASVILPANGAFLVKRLGAATTISYNPNL